jgi:hypothetical protein
MRRFIVSALLFSLPALAQVQGPLNSTHSEENWQRLQRELWHWQLENQWSAQQREAAQRAAEYYERREFARRVARFVEVWNQFISEYNRKGTFNVKRAKALDKAFRDLEVESWPR